MVKKGYKPEQIINKLRDELLNREIFTTLTEVKVLIEQWRRGRDELSLKQYLAPAMLTA